jgi:hypothetical protein
MKLLVWESDTGMVRQKQTHGIINDRLIDRYAEKGRTARPFKKVDHPIGQIFWNGKKIAQRPSLNAKLEKTSVKVGGVAKIVGVPAGAHIVVADGLNSERYGPTDGKVIHMQMQDRGRRTITVHAFPHLRQTLHLNVE